MKKILSLLIILIFTACKNEKASKIVKKLTTEQKVEYKKLKTQAWQLYESKDYLKSAQKYASALNIIGDKDYVYDRYNAACSWALANKVDSSFIQLFHIAKKSAYSNYKHISNDPDLKNLHSDKRWNSLLNIIKKNKAKEEANFDRTLVAILDTVFSDDQGLRKQIGDVEKEFGRDSDEMDAHWKKMAKTDSTNLIKVQKIIDEHGWLGKDIIGKKGNMTLFLVIQHSPIEIQKKYLPIMKEAVKKGNANPSSLALLEDRVALRTGNKQIYGSQIGRNKETGEFYVKPIEDPENVDKRRESVNLNPLSDYISKWNLTWDIEKHKALTRQLEAKQKQ